MSVNTFLELCETAYWRGQKEQEFRRPQKPGQFVENLPPEVREKLKTLKSDDLKNVRWDAIFWMCHPPLFQHHRG